MMVYDHTEASPLANNAGFVTSLRLRLQSLLLHLAICTILLPVGAQAMVAGFVGLFYLFCRGPQRLAAAWVQREDARLQPIWRVFFMMMAFVWSVHLLSLLAECAGLNLGEIRQAIVLHLRLMGKQGFYGYFIISSFILFALQHPSPSRSSLFKVNLLLVFTSFYALYMWGQRLYGWDWVHGWNATLGEHRWAYGVYRASGFMGHPLTLAFNALIFSLLTFAQGLWLWKMQRGEAIKWLCLSGLCLIILFLSGSRFPLLLSLTLMMVGLLVHTRQISQKIFRRSLPLAISGFVLGSLGFFLLDPNLFGRFSELLVPNQNWELRFDRLVFWKVHLKMALDQPLLGVGLARYDERLLDYYLQAGYTHIERKYSAHNIYLQTLADLGLLGFIGLLGLLAAVARLSIKIWKTWRHLGLILMFLGLLLSGIMQNNLRDSEFLFALWSGIGLVMSWILVQGTKSESGEPRTNFQDNQS